MFVNFFIAPCVNFNQPARLPENVSAWTHKFFNFCRRPVQTGTADGYEHGRKRLRLIFTIIKFIKRKPNSGKAGWTMNPKQKQHPNWTELLAESLYIHKIRHK